METKPCYLCKENKPLDDFILRIDNTYYNMCKSCVSEILKKSTSGKRQKLNHTETHRTCYLCRRFLLNSEFTRRKVGTYFSACKDCNKNVFSHRRRSRMNDAEGSFTTAEWEELKAKYNKCPMCERLWGEIPPLDGRISVITIDHIIPISKGGSNFISNLQPLCYSCNSAKGNK